MGPVRVRHHGQWEQQFSGEKVDPTYAQALRDWVAWLRQRVHARGLCLAGNDYFSSDDPAGFLTVADGLDIVIDEHGFTDRRGGRPADKEQGWLTRMRTYQQVAAAKPLVIIDHIADTPEQVSKATIAWSIANYLLVKGDRTFLAMTSLKGIPAFEDYPELYIRTGRPLAAMETDGRVFFRRFENAVAVVNPSSAQAASFMPPGPGWRDLKARQPGRNCCCDREAPPSWCGPPAEVPPRAAAFQRVGFYASSSNTRTPHSSSAINSIGLPCQPICGSPSPRT